MKYKYYDHNRYARIKDEIDRNSVIAKKLLDEYKRDYPGDESICILEMKLNNSIHNYEKTIEIGESNINKQFHSESSISNICFEYGVALQELNRREEAKELFEKSISLYTGKENYKCMYKLISLYINDGDYDSINELSSKYRKDYPELFSLADAKMNFFSDNYYNVIHILNRLNDKDISFNIGLLQEKAYYLGSAYANMEEYDLALDILKSAHERKKDDYRILAKLLKIELALDNYNAALGYATKLLKEDKFKQYALNSIGRCYYELGDYDDAIKFYSDLEDLQSRYDGIARTYQAMLDIDSSYDYYCKSLGVSKDDETDELEYDKRHNGALVRLITLCLRKNRFDLAGYLIDYVDEDIISNDNSIKHIKRMIELNDKKKVHHIDNTYGYIETQMYSYSEREAKNHIFARHYNRQNDAFGCFNMDYDIDRLMSYMKKKIQDINPTFIDFTDKYIIDLEDDCMVDNPNKYNKIEVVTLMNTKDIITAYPVNMDYKKEDREKPKRLSKIDKFRLKYGDKY